MKKAIKINGMILFILLILPILTINVTADPDYNFEIKELKGGIGFTAIVENTGNLTTDFGFSYNIKCKRFNSGGGWPSYCDLDPGNQINVHVWPFPFHWRHLGKVTIKVWVEWCYQQEVEKTVEGFGFFGFFLIFK